MSTTVSTPEEFSELYRKFFFGGFFDGVIDVDKGISYDTALSEPDSKTIAAEYLLYHVNIPADMVQERMNLLSLVSRLVSMYLCKTRQEKGNVASFIFAKVCHVEVDAGYAGEKSGERATEAAKLAGTYLWRVSQITKDSDVILIKNEWFKKAKEYGLEFNPKEEFLKEAEKLRRLGRQYDYDSSKYQYMYYVRKSLDSIVSLEGLFT